MRAVTLALSVLLLVPLAAANEAHPDCEDATPHDTDGDQRNDRVEDQPWIGWRHTDLLRDVYAGLGAPGGLRPCEGEHWDGQDPVWSGGAACNGPRADASPQGASFDSCMGADPNAPSNSHPGGRASLAADRAYASANAPLAGRAAVYVDSSSAALYVRDNTPDNLVWGRTWSVTNNAPIESDCDQSTYHSGVRSGDSRCNRDNTAVTIEHGLLP